MSIGGPEILIVLVVALLVLGPQRLPEAARQLGRALAEVRRVTAGFQAELRDTLNEPAAQPPIPPAPTGPVATPPSPGPPPPGDVAGKADSERPNGSKPPADRHDG